MGGQLLLAWFAGARFDIAFAEFKQQMGDLLFSTNAKNASLDATADHSEL